MRNRLFIVSLGCLAIAACGSDASGPETGEHMSTEEVVARAEANPIKPQPGQYRASMEVLELTAAGAPQEAIDMMKQMMSRSFEYCLSEEDAEGGFEEMLKEGQDENCGFEKFELEGGDFDAVMSCKGGEEGNIRMSIKGTGTETSSDTTVTMEGGVPGMGDGKMVMRNKHERIGDCG